MKALLLAAGLGTRLRPLTNHIPKPLCLYYGQPILDLVYKQIRRSGIRDVAVNTHHLANIVSRHIEQHPEIYSHDVQISFEPEILGTGGSVNPLRSWIGSEELLIYNADIIANIDLIKLVEIHRKTEPLATMVLLPNWKNGTNPVFCKDGKVLQIGTEKPSDGFPTTFSGVHIISRRLIDAIPKGGFHHIIDTYQTLLTSGEAVSYFLHEGFWADLGNPKDYWQAHMDLLESDQRISILEDLGFFDLNSAGDIRWDLPQKNAFYKSSEDAHANRSFIFGPLLNQPSLPIQEAIIYPLSPIQGLQSLTRCIVTPEVNLSF